MGRPRPKKISKAEQRSLRRKGLAEPNLPAVEPTSIQVEKQREPSVVRLPATIVMKELAARLGLPIGKLLTAFIRQGIMVTINSSVDFDTAALVIEELGFETKPEERIATSAALDISTSRNVDISSVARPPIVTVMGHVDHGKTSLLDAIRDTNVVSGESGGITQHMGAYQVEIPMGSQPEVKSQKSKVKSNHSGSKRIVTFLDTPGHEAFAALRAHGANLTDIVVLVVAADDGVRPQTLEALSHAQAANVPIVVALTKIDLPGADIAKVKAQLAEHQLISEEWGGKTPMVALSSKTKEGIAELLEMLLLVADLANYTAPVEGSAEGVVIESHQEVGLGPVATILIQRGTLHPGDILASPRTLGRVRSLRDWRGQSIQAAHPSDPVQVSGFKSIPAFGDEVRVFGSEKAARALVGGHRGTDAQTARQTVGDISEQDFPVIIKADTQGSIEALKNVLEELATDDIRTKILAAGIGPVSDSDVYLAVSARATVLAFGVPTLTSARALARAENVPLLSSKIIYELVDQTVKALNDRLTPVTTLEEIGRLKILQVFSTKKLQTVLGGSVTKGRIELGGKVTIRRDGQVIGSGTITSLRQGPAEIREIGEGQEVGVRIEATLVPEPGDILDVTKEIVRVRRVEAPTKHS